MFKRVALVLALGLTALASTAEAQTTCSRYGNQTYCQNNSTGQRTTCSQYGNQTYCN